MTFILIILAFVNVIFCISNILEWLCTRNKKRLYIGIIGGFVAICVTVAAYRDMQLSLEIDQLNERTRQIRNK